MEENKAIELDPEAQQLFSQFGGMQAYERPENSGESRVAQNLLEEQKRYDATRILMVQAAVLISHYLASDRFATTEAQEQKVFDNLVQALFRLGKVPGHLGCIMIRFRGTPHEADTPERLDYEVTLGHALVDTLIVAHIARRNGIKFSKLPEQLRKAFSVLADYGVNNIFLRLPEQASQNMTDIRLSLKILSGFRMARHSDMPIVIQSSKGQLVVPLIKDENLFPDPNLTLLAGINRFSAKTMSTLVDKVDKWLRQKEGTSEFKRFAGVYNATLELPKISAQVKKPSLELNNVKWLIAETDEQEITAEKVNLARLAMAIESASPQTAAKMIQSVYGEDYAAINKQLLGERLHLSSNLLDAAEKRSKEADLTRELLSNLKERLDAVKDQVIDDIQVIKDTGEPRPEGQERPKEMVHKDIYDMVTFYKGRSTTRKKMTGMVHRTIDFTDKDYEILAKDFRISTEDAVALVKRLKNCFSEEGRFRKSGFANAIPHFQKYEQKIFHFLWHHMKDTIVPQDRSAFLNALQGLTTQMNQPKKALKILIEDFCGTPDAIQYSDNKAIMLSNLVVHRDKLMTDYDMTPEDIVLSRHNIDAMVAQYAAWRIEKDIESFSTKVQTIHNMLLEALQTGQAGEQRFPAAVLLNLERELLIFLSMVECDTGKSILRSAAAEYGDPDEKIYHLKESGNCLGALLQNMRVALRGVGSLGTMEDVPLLEKVRRTEETFGRLKNDRHYRAQARLITEWVDEAVKLIKFRG